MSNYYGATLRSSRRSLKRNQNAVRFVPSTASLGPVSNLLLIGMLLCSLGLMYLTQVTKTSSYGYQVSELGVQKEALVEANEVLQVESARLQALERIQTSEVAKQLETAETIDYVR